MPSSSPHSTRTYLINIAWSWLSVAALLLSGIFVTRFLILHLGKSRFGIWALAVSLIEYLWMIDLGFRPATVKLSAEYRALGRLDDINRLINTALSYSVSVGLLVLAFSWLGANRLAATFHIDDPAFPFLIRTVGLSWAAGLACNIFAATLEGFQRFDLSNRCSLVASLLRSGISVIVVYEGFGLREMGWALLGSQSLGYLMMFYYCREIHPDLRFSPSLVSWPIARNILSYARQVVPGIIGARFSQGALPSTIALFKPTQFVTFYTQSQRMMDYAADAISRVGLVTAPRVSDWQARGYRLEIIELTRVANRYCLTLWGLIATFLLVYGGEVCRIWIDRDFSDNVAPLLIFFLIGYTFFMGQFISAAVLMGIARYQTYSIVQLFEAFATVAAMALLLPRFGLAAGVAGGACVMIVSRCFILSHLYCKEFEIGQAQFLWSVFSKPFALMAATGSALLLVHRYALFNVTLLQLAGVVVVFSLTYALCAFKFVVKREHQEKVLLKLGSMTTRFLPGRFATEKP